MPIKTKKTPRTRTKNVSRTTMVGTKLTQPLYNYVTPTNGKWVRSAADKAEISYSKFMNNLIEFGRRKKFIPTVRGIKRAA